MAAVEPAGIDEAAVARVVRGEAQFTSLTPAERAVAHQEIDAEITARVASVSFGRLARDRGESTVALDDAARLVVTEADGTVSYV